MILAVAFKSLLTPLPTASCYSLSKMPTKIYYVQIPHIFSDISLI